MTDETPIGDDGGPDGSAGPGDETVADSTPYEPEHAELPSSIGPYEILGKLGEGGMGVVFEAEQQKPRRKVALKVVRGGQFVDDAQVKMFQREADTLARLKHPNIAAIYESGRTEGGQHFFAMELVRGKTLDEWTVPSLHPRLELFRKIADAVNYAHQRGVIHRDLKPSNIVVLDETPQEESSVRRQSPPEIKILDFGLARITDTDVAAASMVTEVGMIKGTLPYMSPEQARGNPEAIDLRTDVYALGVILYEMISGSRPYDTNTSSLVEAVRVICETPPKSLSLSYRGKRKLDRDIETIVGKALDKDPDRRYASAAALSEDIDRYLTSQPILARPPSTAYQLRKFAARNKALVGGIAATFVVLVTGIVVSTMFGLREAEQRRTAVQAQADLESVVEFQAGMLSATDPEAMGRRLMQDLSDRVAELQRAGGSTEAQVASSLSALDGLVRGVNATDLALGLVDEDILGRAVTEMDEKFGDRPLIDARLRGTIGDTYRNLGRYERSEPQLEAALATRKRVLGDDHPDTLGSMHSLALLYENQGRYTEAEALVLETLETRKRVLGYDHPNTLESVGGLAFLYFRQGHYDKAEPLYLENLETRKRVLGDNHLHTLRSMNNLAFLYMRQGRYAEAEPLFLEALENRKRVLGDDHPDTLGSVNDLAILYENQGRYDKAEPLYLENLETQKRVLGDDHPDTLNSMNNLAIVYEEQGRYAKAEPLVLETLETRQRVLGDDHPFTLSSMNNLAVLYKSQGRLAEAEKLHVETLEIRQRVLGDDHPDTVLSMNNLAFLYGDQGRDAEAESLHLENLERQKRALGDDHPSTLKSVNNLARFYKGRRRYAEAEPLLVQTLEGRRRALGDDHPQTLFSMNNLAFLYLSQGRYAVAEPLFLRTIESQKRVLGNNHGETIDSMLGLANLYGIQGRHDEAEPLVLEILETKKRVFGDEHPDTLRFMTDQASRYRNRGRYAEAEPLVFDALDIQKRVLGDDHPDTLQSMYWLACLAALQGKQDDAMDWLLQSVEGGFDKADGMAQDFDLESLHGPEFDALVERARENAFSRVGGGITVEPQVLEQYVGTYELAPNFKMMVTLEGNQLSAQATGQRKAPIYAETETTFFYMVVDARIKFFKNDQGTVTYLLLYQNNREMKGVRTSDEVAQRKEISVLPEILKQYVGTYELDPGFDMVVTLEDGQLITQATGQGKIPIFAETETIFFPKILDAQIEFFKDENGGVTHLMLHQGTTEIKALRK